MNWRKHAVTRVLANNLAKAIPKRPLNIITKPDVKQTVGVIAASSAILDHLNNPKKILAEATTIALIAGGITSPLRNMGVNAMKTGGITQTCKLQSFSLLEPYRYLTARTLLVESIINMTIVALLDDAQSQLKLDKESGGVDEQGDQQLKILKICLANIVATAFALRSDCLTINKNMTNSQFNKLYLTGFTVASLRNLASALAVIFNDDIRTACNIDNGTLQHELLTLGLGASAAII